MYGATEAASADHDRCPRSACPTSSGRWARHCRAVASRCDTQDGDETTEPGVSGEVVYRGPNVMMGYAETPPTWPVATSTAACSRPGDLGHLDYDGFLWITGRLQRIGKMFGVRVNLDDIEAMLHDQAAGRGGLRCGQDRRVA